MSELGLLALGHVTTGWLLLGLPLILGLACLGLDSGPDFMACYWALIMGPQIDQMDLDLGLDCAKMGLAQLN